MCDAWACMARQGALLYRQATGCHLSRFFAHLRGPLLGCYWLTDVSSRAAVHNVWAYSWSRVGCCVVRNHSLSGVCCFFCGDLMNLVEFNVLKRLLKQDMRMQVNRGPVKVRWWPYQLLNHGTGLDRYQRKEKKSTRLDRHRVERTPGWTVTGNIRYILIGPDHDRCAVRSGINGGSM